MVLQRINNRIGFTLIELMIVIAIVAISAAVIIPFATSILQGTGDSEVEIIDQEDENIDQPETPIKNKEEEKLWSSRL